MKDIEEKLAMFCLDDQSVKDALNVLDLVKDAMHVLDLVKDVQGKATYTVETIIVLDGEAKVIAKESISV